MADTKVDDILKQLSAEHQRLSEQRDTVLRTAENLEAEMKKLQKAMIALGAEPPATKSRRTHRKGLNGVEVTALVEAVLKDQGPQSQPKLRELVVARAAQDGQNTKGIPLVLSKVLKSGRFDFNGAKWQLRNGTE